MILTARRQRRILSAMHSSLRSSDPRLVATFLIFTRLTSDEAIPSIERIKAGPRRWLRAAVRHAAIRWRRATGGPERGLRWAVGPLVFLLAVAPAFYLLGVAYR